MEQMIIIQAMLDNAKTEHYDLSMECLVSMINDITDNKLTLNQLSNACDAALTDWDL
tara:strand:+ start:301 stop:471 length:171 start_codon:yes stop_codon:yes gene_type:complete